VRFVRHLVAIAFGLEVMQVPDTANTQRKSQSSINNETNSRSGPCSQALDKAWITPSTASACERRFAYPRDHVLTHEPDQPAPALGPVGRSALMNETEQ
jgi:hypothetical protein